MLETERLVLRQWQSRDYAEFAELNADPKVMEFFPACLTVNESDALAQRLSALIDQQGWGFWAIELKQNQRFMGFCGLHQTSPALPFSPNIEIGWRLHVDYWGQGYAAEAAQAALQFGFEQLQLKEIVAFTALGNLRSQTLMERLGMQRDPLNFAHPALPAEHALAKHCLYRCSTSALLHNAQYSPARFRADNRFYPARTVKTASDAPRAESKPSDRHSHSPINRYPELAHLLLRLGYHFSS